MVAPDRDRLRRAFRVPAKEDPTRAERVPADVAKVARDGELRQFLQGRVERFRAPSRVRVDLPPGEACATEHGVLWRRELCYPADFVHGTVPLARALALDGERLATLAKDPSFATLDPRRCLFLDTETTGLAGGAGTVVFAYGLAFWRDDQFVVEQLFLRDFGEEPAMLQRVTQRLREFPTTVTFVGKSYDRHRIAARMAVHKVRTPVLTVPHLDLYYLARRAYKGQWPDTRLGTVERNLLGVHRSDDLPGSEAPAAFLDWIRDGTGPVDRVLEHNRLDVLSLVTLLGMLAGHG